MHALVAVDLEAGEEDSLFEHVHLLLDRIAGTVAVVYVDTQRPPPDLAVLLETELTRREEGQRRRLEAFLERFPPDRRGALHVLYRSKAADAIVDLAPGHDVIVVGTHGRRGVARLWLGSVAELVVRSSPIPVLVVRGPTPAVVNSGARILAAVDLDEGADPLAAETVRWALALRATVDAVYVVRPSAVVDPGLLATGAGLTSHLAPADPSARHRVEGWMQRIPSKLRGVARVQEGEPAAAVVAASDGYLLVLLGTRGRSGPERLWLGSVAERVARLCEVPVLIAPIPPSARTSGG